MARTTFFTTAALLVLLLGSAAAEPGNSGKGKDDGARGGPGVCSREGNDYASL
jgi:hypothetical protein